MASMLVTCPETAHLEKLHFDDHPLGMLVVRCSAYPGECPPACPRTCAKRLDQRRKLQQKRLADGSILFATSCLRRT